MYSIEAYDKLHQTYAAFTSSGGFRTLPEGSTVNYIKSIGRTLNLIDSWLQSLEANNFQRIII